MGKYTHLTEDEIREHVEKFGTEDERIIVEKLRPKMDYDDCPHCEELMDDIDELKGTIDAVKELVS